jgi:hypothetical protein
MRRFKKIAFRANVGISLQSAARLLENEECSEVYIVGVDPIRVFELRAAGLTVHEVATLAELPADVYHWYRHQGHWAAIHTESGYIRDVGFAEDSITAFRALTSTYADDYRKQFHVEPVKVERLERFKKT